MVPRFARAVLRSVSSGSGLWLWPHMDLAIDHVRVMQQVVQKPKPDAFSNPRPMASPQVLN
jgi:hypothetical protein